MPLTRLLRRATLRAFAALMPDRVADWFEDALLRPRPGPPLDIPDPGSVATVSRFPYGWGWLSVRAWGNAGGGESPTVLLLHGWGGTSRDPGAFVDPLVRAGHRVVAFDFPAHGESDGRRTNLIEAPAPRSRSAPRSGRSRA